MPLDRIKTTSLETILNDVDHPHIEDAINELHTLRAVNNHLTTMFVAVKTQADHTAENVIGLLSYAPLLKPPDDSN